MTLEYRIEPDPDPMTPADWDEPVTLYLDRSTGYAAHARKGFTDVSGMLYYLGEGADPATHVCEYLDAIAAFPVRFSGYGSSGAQVYLNDDWDDANGVAFITAASWAMCMGADYEATSERLREVAESCVGEWDKLFRGEVYGVVVEDEAGEVLNSCWGFYGYEYAEDEARDMLAHAEAARARETEARSYWAARDVETIS